MRRRALALLLLLCLLAGCAPAAGGSGAGSGSAAHASNSGAPEIQGLTFQSQLELQYATCFSVYRYAGGYTVLDVTDGRRYLVVPEGGAVPSGAADCVILQQPLDRIYLVATAAMSLFCALDGLESIRLSGTKEEGWYIDAVAQAMAAGNLLYAGKYAAPDYELLTDQACDLAVESTMIYHCPEVQEKIEELGIPVFIDRSSYETHPLGRTEWMKAYAVLLGKEEQAERLFAAQAEIVDSLAAFENTEQTVAFFYVTNEGTVSVRKSSDYFAKMIEMAGGRYIFQDLGDPDSATSGVTMTMEEFYASAKDADCLIYNATIDDPLTSISQLLAKSDLLSDFKAVQSGNVWCTNKSLFQATDCMGTMISDLHEILSGAEQAPTFFYRIEP